MKATKKAKAAKKSVMHKGKSLEAVKPLTKIAAGANTSSTPTENVSLPYNKIEWTYKSQG
jgi:type VI protein secretion system component Hcp